MRRGGKHLIRAWPSGTAWRGPGELRIACPAHAVVGGLILLGNRPIQGCAITWRRPGQDLGIRRTAKNFIPLLGPPRHRLRFWVWNIS